ncbi:MAG: hypothetical protein PHS54_00645 [Clostridia bacterium]|nr:hypothetical protein [Clostridia bacterium]
MKCGTNSGAGLRFTSKVVNENERRVIQNYWIELNKLYGTYIDFYTYDYQTSAHDFFYGEHPLAPFSGPTPMIMMAQFNNDSLLLSKFGIRTDADATFIVPILTFRAAFNSNAAEPKAGDLIRLTEFGWDRPGGMNDINTISNETTSCSGYALATDVLELVCGSTINPTISDGITCTTDSTYYSTYNDVSTFQHLMRGAPIFEITERRDENLTMNYNMLQGHYVWILHCKRFDYSYQPNAPREPGHDQISDETLYGKLSGGSDYAEEPKKYDQNVEDESRRIWDYSKTPGSDNSVYGNY